MMIQQFTEKRWRLKWHLSSCEQEIIPQNNSIGVLTDENNSTQLNTNLK